MINIYRETEVSLAELRGRSCDAPRSRGPSEPGGRRRADGSSRSTTCRSSTSRPPSPALHGRVASSCGAARRSPSWDRRARARRRWSSCWSVSIGPGAGASSTTGRPTTEVDLDELRERIGFVTQDTQLFSGLDPREPALRAARTRPTRSASTCSSRPPASRCWRGPTGPRHGDRRGRRQGLGRREAAALDRARAAAPAAPAGVRRGDLVARLAHRGGDQPDDPRGRGRPRRDHDPDRAPALDGACTPTGSTCSSAAASWSRGRTTSCSRPKGLYYAMWRQQVGERRLEPAHA